MYDTSISNQNLHTIISEINQLFNNSSQNQQNILKQDANNEFQFQKTTSLNDKEIQKLVNIFENDNNNFCKSYKTAHILLELFKNELVQKIENPKIQINLINIICNSIHNLNGLEICNGLNSIVNYIIQFNNENQCNLDPIILNPSQNHIQQQENHKDFYNILYQAESPDFLKKIQALESLLDIFSEQQSYFQQMNLFASISQIIKALCRIPLNMDNQLAQIKDFMIYLSKFTLTLIVSPNVKIEFEKAKENQIFKYFIHSEENYTKKSQNQEQLNKQLGLVIDYEIRGISNVLKNSEHIYSNLALIVNSLLLFPKDQEIVKYCLNILRTTYQNFPNFRENLQNAILSVLQNSEKENEQVASNFLYEIQEDFSNIITTNHFNIQRLFKSQFFNKRYLENTIYNRSITSFQNLVVRNTFAQSQIIEAEKNYTYYIEVKKPHSIIYIGFATMKFDIRVQIQSVNLLDESQNVIYLNERIECNTNPHKAVLLVQNPGIFQVEFDNTYSWYNEKNLRFRCLVLEPQIKDKSQIQNYLNI